MQPAGWKENRPWGTGAGRTDHLGSPTGWDSVVGPHPSVGSLGKNMRKESRSDTQAVFVNVLTQPR